jgi:very-short-patch-repair endonuclease
LARLIEDLGFPRPTRQVRVLDVHGNFVAQVDFGYPEWKIAIEGDSETWHTGSKRFHDDRTRRNLVTAAGWELLTYTYDHYRRDHRHIRSTLSAAIRRQVPTPPEIA